MKPGPQTLLIAPIAPLDITALIQTSPVSTRLFIFVFQLISKCCSISYNAFVALECVESSLLTRDLLIIINYLVCCQRLLT